MLLPHNWARWSAGNTVSTSIIKAVQKRTKGFYRSYFMKSSWCDTDGRRDRGKWCLKVLWMKRADCLDKAEGRNGTGYDMTQKREREREGREEERNWGCEGWGGEKEEGEVFNSWQKGHTYCRAHTHTGPPGICRFLGRGRGRHLNQWSRCTGSDCCICQRGEKETETNLTTMTLVPKYIHID